MPNILIIVAFLLLGACSEKYPINTISGDTMGTTYSIKISGTKTLSKSSVDEQFVRINKIFSNWDEHSELSLLNKAAVGTPIATSKELLFVLKASQKLHQQTEGYFDPGLGKLIELWGFGVKKINQPPKLEQIRPMLADASIGQIELKNNQVKKLKDVHINLSAIAKGYALDALSQLLMRENITNFLIEIGGEVIAHGKNGTQEWTVGIEHPNRQQPIPIKLNNKSIATSGNYRNYFVYKNKQYPHILNPKTGLPVKSDLSSVSVLHPSAMVSDALATAMMAMGSQKAYTLAKRYHLPTILILDRNNAFKVVKINL